MAGRYLSSKNHRPPGTARAANSFKSRSLASWPLCLPAPFGELFGYSAKGKAIAARATLTGCRGPARLPSALLRFRLPAVLSFFGPSGALSGAFSLHPVHLPGCLPLRPSCVPLWPSFAAFFNTCRCLLFCVCSAFQGCRACLPKEVKAARFPAVGCFAASLPALALPGLPGIRTKNKGRPALLCVSAAP